MDANRINNNGRAQVNERRLQWIHTVATSIRMDGWSARNENLNRFFGLLVQRQRSISFALLVPRRQRPK